MDPADPRNVSALHPVTRSSTITALVAEDDPADQMLFMMAAEESGLDFEFSFAEDGIEVLSLLEEQQQAGSLPDLLILDMRMPRKGGHEVLEDLAERTSLRPAEVGILSTSHRQQDIDRSLSKGAAWHVVKPSRFEELVEFLETIVERRRAAEGI